MFHTFFACAFCSSWGGSTGLRDPPVVRCGGCSSRSSDHHDNKSWWLGSSSWCSRIIWGTLRIVSFMIFWVIRCCNGGLISKSHALGKYRSWNLFWILELLFSNMFHIHVTIFPDKVQINITSWYWTKTTKNQGLDPLSPTTTTLSPFDRKIWHVLHWFSRINLNNFCCWFDSILVLSFIVPHIFP